MTLENSVVRGYKYKIEQTSKGARVTVHGDALEETVADYATIRQRLQTEGFTLAPEE
jgi:hypothetical protein